MNDDLFIIKPFADLIIKSVLSMRIEIHDYLLDELQMTKNALKSIF